MEVSGRVLGIIIALVLIGGIALSVYVGRTHNVEFTYNIARCYDQGGYWVKGWCYTSKGK